MEMYVFYSRCQFVYKKPPQDDSLRRFFFIKGFGVLLLKTVLQTKSSFAFALAATG